MADAKQTAAFSMEDIMNTGPPPDMLRRQLVFDSLSKIIDNKVYTRAMARGGSSGMRCCFKIY